MQHETINQETGEVMSDTAADVAQTTGYVHTPPNFGAMLEELQGGAFESVVSRLMANVAMAVAETGDARKKGKLVLTFTFAPTNSEQMLDIEHAVEFKHPTVKGWKAEQVVDKQPMFVNRKGALTASPDNQGKFAF